MSKLVKKQPKKSNITVGLEFEVHRVLGLTKKEAQKYNEQLKKAKKARILKDLKIDNDASKETSYLCRINYKGQPFMDVIFDDNSEKSRLEFISAVGNGVLPYKDFFNQKNLQLIKTAVEDFPKVIKELKKQTKLQPKLQPGQYVIKMRDCQFEIPAYACDIFTKYKFEENKLRNAGTIHVTHTVPMNKEFLGVSKIQEQFIKDTGGTHRKTFMDEVTSDILATASRTHNSPNPKVPQEVLMANGGVVIIQGKQKISSKESKYREEAMQYIEAATQREVLFPMSNLVVDMKEDIELYKELYKELDDNHFAQQKKVLLNTVTRLNKLVDSREKLYGSLAQNIDKMLLFSSYEEKFQPIIYKGDKKYFLAEHRTQGSLLVKHCNTALKTNKEVNSKDINKVFKLLDKNLKRVEKSMLLNSEEVGSNKKQYILSERLAKVNNHDKLELLSELENRSIVEKEVDIEKFEQQMLPKNKTPAVEIKAESNHATHHSENIQSMIKEINSGKIASNTIIALERKQYGQNLGMKDIIKIANILEHNEKNPNKKITLPKEIEKSLIYQDALLYKTAKEKKVKVIGLEGKNLNANKNSLDEYNKAREKYMVNKINQLTSKGYNVIVNVGSAHEKNIKKYIQSKKLPPELIKQINKIRINLKEQSTVQKGTNVIRGRDGNKRSGSSIGL